MKPTFCFLLFLFLGVCSFGQTGQSSCETFKTGKFAYRDSANHLVNVTRKGGQQQEYDTKTGITTKFKIKWTAGCEYELIQTWSTSKIKRKQNRSVTRVVITKANGNDSYEYDCGCKDREINGHSGTMVRLSE